MEKIYENAQNKLVIMKSNIIKTISAIGGNSEWFTATDREMDIRIIMKNGEIYKNAVEQ